MIELSLVRAASLLGIKNITSTICFRGISIDTRRLQPGNLFLALPGEHVDGHDFIEEAARKGASAALVTRPINASIPQLLVDDPILALGKLAAYWREQFELSLVAVTGSNGKTTLKNMIAAIFTAASNSTQTLSTQGTLNNHLGLPLTLLQLNSQHRYAAIEMGMNHFGEIAYLTQLARPQVAAITNAGPSHLEGVGDLSGVARAKAEIFRGLPADGIAVLNRDDTFYDFWCKEVSGKQIITFGFHKEAHIRAEIKNSNSTWVITPSGNVELKLPLLGQHNIANALAATACALAVNIPVSIIKTGLENIKPAPGRLQLHELANGIKIIDDTYNANPLSLEAALETLLLFSGKKIVVLGDMKELGSDTERLHYVSGEKLRQSGVQHLFTYGQLSVNTSQAFGKGALHFEDQKSLQEALRQVLDENTVLLVKGSRSMHMEKIVTQLLEPSVTTS